ncbi:MAG: cupin domain-containing protein [Treponema sp.]|nr:cupin domain-containing protein [Treponema sp.]
MYIVDEKDREYRFGDSGPKYLMRGPRSNFAIVQFMPGQDFQAHYHEVMEENFYILEGIMTIVVDGVVHDLKPGQFIHLEPKESHYVLNRTGEPARMVSTLAPFKDSDKIEVDNPIIG